MPETEPEYDGPMDGRVAQPLKLFLSLRNTSRVPHSSAEAGPLLFSFGGRVGFQCSVLKTPERREARLKIARPPSRGAHRAEG